jgi:FkbM family methyltransferase
MLPDMRVCETPSGKFILLDAPDLVNRALIALGVWEPMTLELAKLFLAPPFVAEGTAGIVIDVGANLGAFTIPIARHLGPAWEIHAFEAQRLIYYQLCGNVVLNALEHVHNHHCALGEAAGLVEIPVPDFAADGNVGGVSLDPRVRAARLMHDTDFEPHKMETVEMRPLDAFVLGNVKLVKIDVEGMECEVLKGGLRTLVMSDFPPVLFEAWDEQENPALAEFGQGAIDVLTGFGYSHQRLGELCIAQHAGRHGRPILKLRLDRSTGRLTVSL